MCNAIEEHKKVSIIVPLYNTAEYLDNALFSLECQTYSNIEIIILDDGSTDESARVCQQYTDRDSRFRYFYQENKGVSAARNTALSYATGEFIAFMDSDDWVEPDYVESLLCLLESMSGDVAVVLHFGQTGQNVEWKPLAFTKGKALKELYRGTLFDGVICGKLFRKNLLDGISFPEKIAVMEDMIFAAKAICRADRIAFRAVPKYHYTLNPNSATKAKWNPKVWTCIDAAKILYEIMRENSPETIAYGGKVACYANLIIAQKLAGCGKLNRENYSLVKNEILKYYDAEVEKVLSLRLKSELHIFFHSRLFYIFCRRFFKSKTILKVCQLITG